MRQRAAASLLYQSKYAEAAFRNLLKLIFLKIVGRILAFYSKGYDYIAALLFAQPLCKSVGNLYVVLILHSVLELLGYHILYINGKAYYAKFSARTLYNYIGFEKGVEVALVKGVVGA